MYRTITENPEISSDSQMSFQTKLNGDHNAGVFGAGGGGSDSAEVAAETSGILDDPFDAEWAALATRNIGAASPTSNPFKRGEFKAFEMQM